LWHTTDGGTSWEQLAPAGIADAQCKSALSFTDAMHGYVAASDPNNATQIYRTADGGRMWSAATLPDARGFALSRVRAFGSTVLAATSADQQRIVYRSTDGGASWRSVTNAPMSGVIALLTATHWIDLVLPNQSQETTDAGASWHSFATDYSQAAPIAPDVVFADERVGYATVRGAIQRTSDGGAHWTSIKTPGTG
jgi:photosystem II stability/assembly factor-like uncharacterized protein